MLKEAKQKLRAEMRSLRAEIPENTRASHSAGIQTQVLELEQITQASTVFCFISYGDEINTHPLLKQFLALGKIVAAPKIVSNNKMLSVQFKAWHDLEKAQRGILAPKSMVPLETSFDVSITPGLAFTESGKRIGYGAGYYDRWFSNNKVGLKIGLAFEAQIIKDIPTDEYDQKVDMIVTEQRVIHCQ